MVEIVKSLVVLRIAFPEFLVKGFTGDRNSDLDVRGELQQGLGVVNAETGEHGAKGFGGEFLLRSASRICTRRRR